MRAIAGFAKATATSVATSVAILVGTLTFAGPAFARIPPPTEAAKAAADEAKAKSSWSDKVAAYKLCLVQDRVAARYRQSVAAQGKQASTQALPQALPTPPCTDPGPYVSVETPLASKPLEASGAHSPSGTAVHPPSTNAHAADIAGGIKK
jgi:hypothetical protein